MEELEQEVVMLDRRQFLSRTAAGVGVALPRLTLLAQLANMPAKLPDLLDSATIRRPIGRFAWKQGRSFQQPIPALSDMRSG